MILQQSFDVYNFTKNQDEVNCVKWNASGLLLASCSDDMTTKVINLYLLVFAITGK